MVKARSTELSAEATTPVVISQGSGRLRLRLSQRYSGWDAEALVTAAELDSGDGGNDCRWETQGYAGRWKCEVAIWLTLPCLYRLVMAAEESSLPFFAMLSEIGLLAFLHSKILN